jgi:F-type H+-transporting ATPase subunit gamma
LANTREIKLRIKGVNGTKKITKAMKLIASVKLRKARAMHETTLPFFKHIQETMIDILERVPNMDLVYFDKREKKENRKKAYIVFTSDSGLTGGYNSNMIKYAVQQIKDKENSIVFTIGNTGKNYLKGKGYNVRTDVGTDFYEVNTNTAGEIAKHMIDLFKKGEIDELELLYTEMESAMSLRPHAIKLLPLERKDFERKEGEKSVHEELEFEPSPELVFDVLTNKYVKGVMYGGMVEAFVSENFSRMNAMDSATSNAEKMVEKLTLNYNRARQAAITQEISEIIGGANNV